MRRALRAAAAAMALGAGLTACSDGPSDLRRDDLFGVWGAVEYQYTSESAPPETVDLVNDLGATYSIELISGGTYTWRLSQSGVSVRDSGTFQLRDGRLTLQSDDGGTTVYDYTFDGVFLTLTADGSYDFDGNGTDEPAALRIRLDRF